MALCAIGQWIWLLGRPPSVISVQIAPCISFAGLRGRLGWGVEPALYVHNKIQRFYITRVLRYIFAFRFKRALLLILSYSIMRKFFLHFCSRSHNVLTSFPAISLSRYKKMKFFLLVFTITNLGFSIVRILQDCLDT